MRIPFDSLCLSAVAFELRAFLGAKVQKVVQPDPYTVVLCLYGPGEGHFLISCDPNFARAHFITKRRKNPQPVLGFCTQLRAHLEGGFVAEARQVGFDRLLEIDFNTSGGPRSLVAELMGKHSNVILLSADLRVIAAAKTVGPAKSRRPVLPGRPYEKPPFEPKPPVWEAGPGDDLRAFEGASPFLVGLIERGVVRPAEIGRLVRSGAYEPVLVRGSGAYPLPLEGGQRKPTLSVALELHYDEAERLHQIGQLRQSLLTQLGRVRLAREAAIHDLEQAADAAKRAGTLQLQAELILAYGPSLWPGADRLEASDYEGNPLTIRLDPELDYKQNANRLFEKAKKAKQAAAGVQEQLARMREDLSALETALAQVEAAEDLERLEELAGQARHRRWLFVQSAPSAGKEERPYQGHKIKELLGPNGWRVLYGENAAANDYLTTKVAKPNDWWFHVRSAVSAHVVIPTANRPERVSREAILFAAKTAALNSASKHSSLVPVDYTLKKYVRKPRGSAPGFVVYDHEKTIDVDMSKS